MAAVWAYVWPLLVAIVDGTVIAVRWFFVKGLRMVPVAMLTTTIGTALLLKWYPDRGRDVVLVLAGFFVSDAIYRFFIGGGSGIGMIPFSGTQARAHGYVFLAVWGGILFSAVAGAWVADVVYQTLVAPAQADFGADLVAGAIFSVVVWADTQLRFLTRPT